MSSEDDLKTMGQQISDAAKLIFQAVMIAGEYNFVTGDLWTAYGILCEYEAKVEIRLGGKWEGIAE